MRWGERGVEDTLEEGTGERERGGGWSDGWWHLSVGEGCVIVEEGAEDWTSTRKKVFER